MTWEQILTGILQAIKMFNAKQDEGKDVIKNLQFYECQYFKYNLILLLLIAEIIYQGG